MTTKTRSQIVWPRASLAGCIFCSIVRDTRGAALDQFERFNYFPASPLCCVTGILEGGLHQITRPDELDQPWTGKQVPKLAFSGPQLGPLVSWSPGDVYVITIGFYPDAFSKMTGLDLSQFVGEMVSANDAVPGPLLMPCQDFFDSVTQNAFETAFEELQMAIEKEWSKARPQTSAATRWLTDWTNAVVGRAALSRPGKSARQIARRIKSWTGANERQLNSLGQTEQLYRTIHQSLERGHTDWAHIAQQSGFSDQAHMIRRLRQHTGFTPEQLRRLAPSEEALWGYRLLGEYFSEPH